VRGRKSQKANKPKGEKARRRISQGANRKRGEKARHHRRAGVGSQVVHTEERGERSNEKQ